MVSYCPSQRKFLFVVKPCRILTENPCVKIPHKLTLQHINNSLNDDKRTIFFLLANYVEEIP